MKPGQNSNRPAPNSTISVEPIRNPRDIKAIKKLLSDKPRDLTLFTLGINTNLRASDLVALTCDMVADLKAGDSLVLKECKTGKVRRITINKAVKTTIRALLADHRGGPSAPLFLSQRGNKALSVPSVSRLVKGWCKAINLVGNYASHSLRKTWGYHQRVTFGTGIPELMVCFNHSTQRQTLDYLCIQPDEIRDVYLNEL
jgi:integrase